MRGLPGSLLLLVAPRVGQGMGMGQDKCCDLNNNGVRVDNNTVALANLKACTTYCGSKSLLHYYYPLLKGVDAGVVSTTTTTHC